MDLKDARGVFISECDELLQEMETALLNDETDAESIRRVFRVIHTIKGSAGIFGFTAIQEFTHDLEFLLDRARSGELTITDEIVRFLLECRDHISDLVAVISELDDDTELEINTTLKEKGARLMAATRDYLGRPEPDAQSENVTTNEEAQPNRSFLIKLRFHEDLFFHGMDPLSFIRYLSQLGTIDNMETIADKVPPLSQMDSEKCYLGFDIKFSGPVSESVIREVFEFVEQDCDINIQALTANETVAASRTQTDESTVIDDSLTSDPDAISQSSQTTSAKSSGQSVENADGNAASESDNTALTASAASNETGRTTPSQIENERSSAQPNESAQARKESESRATIERTSRDVSGQIKRESHNIRVDAEKLDFLVNLVGELVVSVAHMSQVAEDSGHTGVLEAAYEVNKMVTELRDNTFRLRMIPIGGVFSRFQRIVYDVGHELGKDVSLVVHGGETELDKNIIEKISDPLMHLVRNAIDHGIESPEIRRSAGKSTHGTIMLNAYNETGDIVIEVGDDGAGLDAERIYRRAAERGLIASGQNLSNDEIYRLIFQPGFSTAETVSNVSGRGVGMDVVQRNIEDLRGKVEIITERGRGTTMRLRLPLTLAIIDGFLVQSGSAHYVIPLDLVTECIEYDASQENPDQQIINLRGEALPYVRLKDFFRQQDHGAAMVEATGNDGSDAVNAESSEIRENLVVVRHANRKSGLIVDRLLGEHQSVIKPLNRIFGRLKGVAGSTILGNGKIALILDVPSLIELIESEDAEIKRVDLRSVMREARSLTE